MPNATQSNAAADLERRLRADVRGEVRFDAGSRALYATDASNYRQTPVGVVVPRDERDVEATIAAARAFDVPVFSRGGGTSLAGETCNCAVVIDFSKYMYRILKIDWDGRWARVEPGCVLDDLRDAAEQRHLTFGPDPATHNRNTLGGMLGNNSCGMHAQMAGKCDANTYELDILTYDGARLTVGETGDDQLQRIIKAGGREGEIYARLRHLRDKYGDLIRERFPKIPRRVSGYGLDQLLPENGFNVARALVGTEGTCVTILQAKLRLVHSPPHRVLVVLGFEDIATAADRVPHCNAHGPIALEGLDESMFMYMHDKGMSTASRAMFPHGNAWLIVEFGGDTRDEADAKAKKLVDDLRKDAAVGGSKIFDDKREEELLWKVRESGLGSTSKIPNLPDFYPGWEDSAVAPERLGDYLRDFQPLLKDFGYTASLYGHFGQGCLHCSIDFDLFTREGIENYRKFVTRAAHLCVKYGGSLSGEHGDGQARGELLPIMYGDELVEAFREFKSIWDPRNKMNPGKIVDANALDADLRWGTSYEPWSPKTHFSLLDDYGSFAVAANRCVGTGKCRKHDAGTMCPSYMATREEMHSTRGRARLLFEMLRGDPLRRTWKNDHVKEALDLCLSCKGCKGECPVNVDMATYKAEFLSHYYERRLRPANAYAFGLMPWLARIASKMPHIVNAITHAPLLSPLMKRLARIAPERRLPVFASQTFRHWFDKRDRKSKRVGEGRSKLDVILWPDTWNNHFHPTTAIAAVHVLEDAGFRVRIPKKQLCCGRPLYDYGMLDLAKRMLREILDELRNDIRSGVYVVGLEPSCVTVFRDEMVNLFPDDHDAKRLSKQSFLLSEFLAKYAPHYTIPQLNRKAVVHQHCHHKSVLDADAEKSIFDRMRLEYTTPDTGCCGMAGAFGFEAGHYDVSTRLAERVLLPNVRATDDETLIVADGFSCREQIAQLSDRQALHPAQVLKMAIDERNGASPGAHLPELSYMTSEKRDARRAALAGGIGLASLGAVIVAGCLLLPRHP